MARAGSPLRELRLLRELGRSYRRLNLEYSRLATVFILMVLSGVLEMSGLSILYPLVLALGAGQREEIGRLLAYLPFAPSFVNDPRVQLQIILIAVAVLYVAKNVVLYISHDYDIKFAMHYYRELIRALYSAHVHRWVLDFRKESSGALANMICVQSERLVHGVVRPLLIAATESFLLLSMLIVIYFVSPWVMFLIVVACGGAAGGYYALFRQKALGWGKQRMRAASVLHELVNNTALGINEIKVFGKEDYLTSRVYSAAVTETEMFHHYEMYLQAPREPRPNIKNILAIAQVVERSGRDPIIILDPGIRPLIADVNEFEKLLSDRRVMTVSPGEDLSRVVLETASKLDAVIISTNTYIDYYEDFPWIELRRISVAIVNGTAVLLDQKLKRAG